MRWMIQNENKTAGFKLHESRLRESFLPLTVMDDTDSSKTVTESNAFSLLVLRWMFRDSLMKHNRSDQKYEKLLN